MDPIDRSKRGMYRWEEPLQKIQCLYETFRLRISGVPESDAEASQAIINSEDFHSFFAKGDGEMGSQLVLRGYVLMILPQVHLRNGE